MRLSQSAGTSAPLLSQRKKSSAESIVVVVDDDAAVREGLSELILSAASNPSASPRRRNCSTPLTYWMARAA